MRLHSEKKYKEISCLDLKVVFFGQLSCEKWLRSLIVNALGGNVHTCGKQKGHKTKYTQGTHKVHTAIKYDIGLFLLNKIFMLFAKIVVCKSSS